MGENAALTEGPLMLDAIWNWVKGLFGGGKGTTQIGSRNKSVSGVTVGDNAGNVVIGDKNVVQMSPPSQAPAPSPPKQPTVRVCLALTNHPISGMINCLSIDFLNTSDRTVFIGNFLLELNDGQRFFCQEDCITGDPQWKREIPAGDKYSFHISAAMIRKFGHAATDYSCALVEDVLGQVYKSDQDKLRRCIADLLEQTQ
jgi:hypothetical protein